MNAEQWNALYPVGTLVFAYPGFRPEDASDARRLVTKTRTAAQVSASGDPVVWVEGEGSYICLTHVDPVAKDVWEKAQAAEAVAVPVALPVGPGSRTILDRARDALNARMTKENLRLVLENVVTYAAALETRVAELEAERHSTNEELSKATEQAHKDRDRIAELEQQLAERSANPIAFRVLDGLVTVAAYTTAGQARQHAEFLARREHRGTTTQELLWRADLDEPEGTEWLTEVTAPGYCRMTGFGVTALPLLDLITETAKEATS